MSFPAFGFVNVLLAKAMFFILGDFLVVVVLGFFSNWTKNVDF
jgi:hypothetical protein